MWVGKGKCTGEESEYRKVKCLRKEIVYRRGKETGGEVYFKGN